MTDDLKALIKDCLSAQKVLSDMDQFPTGQSILYDAARALTSQQAAIEAARAEERERCAKVADTIKNQFDNINQTVGSSARDANMRAGTAETIAAAIRAGGDHD